MNVLAFIWVGIIAFGIIIYVLLDGFGLGAGILSFFIKDGFQRDITISSILPVWDGNETWLVFGGAALYGAFPLAFSTILPILYLPLLIMVIALLFRGVAFEFRMKAHKSKAFWDGCFFMGSLVATFIQGVMLGSFIIGYRLGAGVAFYQWLSPFSIVCGLALIFGYSLLGSNRLIVKTTGDLQQRFYRISEKLQYVILIFAVAVSIWSPYLDHAIYSRWYDLNLMPFLAILPTVTILVFSLHVYAIKKRWEKTPFFSLVTIFLLCYVGFIVSTYPFIVPRHITFTQAAAPHTTLVFMLVGACIMLPLLLLYTIYSYYIFRGKITKPLSY